MARLLLPLVALFVLIVVDTASALAAVRTERVVQDLTGISEPACLDTATRLQRAYVPVDTSISPSGVVGVSYAYWEAAVRRKLPAVVLVHGFDSSCLEYRRLGSVLAEQGCNVYAVDLLGWGFTQLQGVATFSAQAKIQALQSFCENHVQGGSYVLAGASLGGAAAIELAAMNTNKCVGLVLIDAQGFVDGIGPMASLPTPLAKLGVGVLQSNPLRSSANQMSYYDKQTYATDEAVVIGRLHTLREGWSDALVSFMQSGGFSPSAKVPTIQVPSLILWGRQDGILDGKEFANKFLESLPNARLQWIEECGHVPHLEKPEETARAIQEFLQQDLKEISFAKETSSTIPATVAAIGALAGAYAADLLPLH